MEWGLKCARMMAWRFSASLDKWRERDSERKEAWSVGTKPHRTLHKYIPGVCHHTTPEQNSNSRAHFLSGQGDGFYKACGWLYPCRLAFIVMCDVNSTNCFSTQHTSSSINPSANHYSPRLIVFRRSSTVVACIRDIPIYYIHIWAICTRQRMFVVRLRVYI